MIVVEQVLPDAQELRPCTSAWESARRLAWVQIQALVGVFAVIYVIAAYYGGGAVAAWMAVAIAATMATLIVSGHIVTTKGARIAAQAAAAQGPARWTFDQDGVLVEASLSTTAFRWETVKTVVEDGDRLVFSLTPSSNAVLPLRALGPDRATKLKDFISTVRASGRLGRGVD